MIEKTNSEQIRKLKVENFYMREFNFITSILINCTGSTLQNDSDKRILHYKLPEGLHVYCILEDSTRRNYEINADEEVKQVTGKTDEKMYPSVILIRGVPFKEIKMVHGASITSAESCLWAVEKGNIVDGIGYNVLGIMKGYVTREGDIDGEKKYSVTVGMHTELGEKLNDIDKADSLLKAIMLGILELKDPTLEQKADCFEDILQSLKPLDECRRPWDRDMTGKFEPERLKKYAKVSRTLGEMTVKQEMRDILEELLQLDLNKRAEMKRKGSMWRGDWINGQ